MTRDDPWLVIGAACGMISLAMLVLSLVLASLPATPDECARLLDHAQATGLASDYAAAEGRCELIY